LIIVDDGSDDNTEEILNNLPSEKVRILKNNQNRGVSYSRNQGALAARTSWLAFLDSDDEWLPGKLKIQSQFIKSHPKFKFIHSEEIWVRNGVRVNAPLKYKKPVGRAFLESLKICTVSPSTCLIHKDLFWEMGGFREDFPVCEDYNLWLKIFSQNEIGFINEPLIKKYGGHEDQLSTKFKAMDYWRVISIVETLQLNSDKLSDVERSFAIEVLRNKTEILINGYQKYGQLEKVTEITEILTGVLS
jgi:glycosyltransferase involved in cell wall biosynthesis